jgi:Asp/Glu/hydantoin racemase
MKASPRIVLIHATPVAMEPIHCAFSEAWSEAELVNLLDDGLTTERSKTHDLSPALMERFIELVHYAHRAGADGILATCSAFGPAIERAASKLPVPVLKPNEAMFHAAFERGNRIGMLATFAPAVVTMEAEFAEEAARRGSQARLETIVIDGAIDLLRKGDVQAHNRLVAQRAPELAHCDAVLLAHFSTSRAAALVQEHIDKPVLSAPSTAVQHMRQLVEQGRVR